MKVRVVSSPLYKCSYIIYLSLLILVKAKDTDESGGHSKKLAKRNDVDLQFCVENFDIQEDTIIRTQDSRAMGAKYINETDLSSREECLKLCCETTSCDVFVFEEKNPGSCYLFNCGPSDDFKCKFTQHKHYTSAILAVSRHAAELESEIQHSKHEQELTRLRASPNEILPSTPSSPAMITTPPPKEPLHPVLPLNTTSTKTEVESASGTTDGAAFRGGEPPDSADPPPASRREKCSRYQFECRSSGECIAIYNACDGIPQCTDGSDEGSELDCPSAASSSPQAHARGQDEGGHVHSHPHQQPKVAAVTTAGTHPATLPPSPPISSQALPNHIPSPMESYSPVRGSHGPQSMPAPMHQIPPQPQQFNPNWAEQQRQQLQMQAQYHSMDNGYNSEGGGDSRSPQFMSSHLQQQQQSHIGYPGENFPMAPANGMRERGPQGPQSNNQWPQLRSGSQMPPSPMGQDWFPHPPNDGGNLDPRYDENGQNRHIFNHKGNGLVADTDRYIHMRSHLNQYNPYAEGAQGEYNSYPNADGKGYIGSNENYFSTPYRQPAQPNWPMMHQKMASSSDPRQMGENPKDTREELMRKHGPSSASNQGLPLPNSAHGDYPPSLQSAGDGHPMGAPIPPDYYYEDGAGGGHHSISAPHRGNNYQRVDPGNPMQAQELAHQKSYAAHHENLPAQHPKQKVLAPPKETSEGDDEGDDETSESEGDESDPVVSLPQEKPQHKKTTTTTKPAIIKQASAEHQSPVHMSLKHEIPQSNSGGDSDIPDGESSRPKGAILSLTLGMGITAIMVALMAWRLRVIKRRFRRGGGKSPYAHDADYLVNGMYL